MSIKTKIIYWTIILFCAAATLSMLSILIKEWVSTSTFRKVVMLLALAGWGYITYNALTFKYKWLRQLVGEEQNKE